MLIQCGQDTHVIPNAHDKVAKYAKDFKIININESKHESYFEVDKIAFNCIDKIIEFYDKKD